ncbi:DUF805 domain-containing protein [Halopseudomonas pelagia]|uniref:DUF805 domain-containing protein n=1 Tax=Halopseudomonas pelagia TaxID=553151 RepID=A0AA91U318_9GAMM|nr:DUF805 domain-containing protein [Halopseudomonas pelagia]PCC99642.1 hypothetical protein CO192_09315 [Halopseudomonas pelagia]QFY54918.1 DUF805 domain-containing protein [Halopseudomonas pelagia]QFY58603.1 DUF805 domain-containing protein [Halopseudomonas pelagia]
MDWYLEVLRKYAVFSGRARRKEYWFFTLFNLLAMLVLSFIDGMIGMYSLEAGVGVLSGIYALGILIPSLAVTVRRLHDTSRTGWWILLAFIPLIGAVVLLIFTVLDSTPGSNKYGPDPKGMDAETPV